MVEFVLVLLVVFSVVEFVFDGVSEEEECFEFGVYIGCLEVRVNW